MRGGASRRGAGAEGGARGLAAPLLVGRRGRDARGPAGGAPALLRFPLHNALMKIAIAGKGGSGKTTIAGTLARVLGRDLGDRLVAIDADSNPNLGITLGIDRSRMDELRPLTRDVVKRVTDEEGKQKTVLARPVEEIVGEYGVAAADGVTLLLMGRVEHAGAG